MTKYIHSNLMLEMDSSSRAKLYKNGNLIFLGNGWVAIKLFISESDTHPDVIARFRQQLELREKPSFQMSEKPPTRPSSN